MMSSTNTAEQLWEIVRQARWFGGKGRPGGLRALTELAVLPGEPPVSVMIAEVGYDDHAPGAEPDLEHYQVPVVVTGSEVTDATADPAALKVIMDRVLAAGLRPEDPDDPVQVRLVDSTGLAPDLPAVRFGGEQSNTSIMYGEVAMLKLFRRLELGRNLDIEVHDVLSRTDSPAARAAAHLFGWVEGTWTTGAGDPVTADLAMLVERLTDVHDGWALAQQACRDGRSFTDEATALGRALRDVHDALATSFSTATVPGASTAAAMRARLERAVVVAPALTAYTERLAAVFGAVADQPVAVQRIHGDFHLGQALVAGTGSRAGWKIIDFEGEPLKTLAERMEPDAVVRDVAGALRSFDYAGTADPSSVGRSWVRACRAAFVAGWVGGRAGALDPTERALLRAYEADKAVYEVVYETRNRPDWVQIPLSGIRVLVEPEPGGTA